MTDIIIFDTCMLPEYYDDVHQILAWPRNYVVTYDYSAKNISSQAVSLFNAFNPNNPIRVVLAYMQPKDYTKGAPSGPERPLPTDSMVVLTRLGEIIAIRKQQAGEKVRYYIDIKLGNYPVDQDNATAKALTAPLIAAATTPLGVYISLLPDNALNSVFSYGNYEGGFGQVVKNISAKPSQFNRDTFFRIVRITTRTKSMFPFHRTAVKEAKIEVEADEHKSRSFVRALDQTSIYAELKFVRGQEIEGGYRSRKIVLEASPKSASDLLQNGFIARAFGNETVSFEIPATTSLSNLEARLQILTSAHSDDEKKEYAYGPQLSLPVLFRKSWLRTGIALISLAAATFLFAWGALATSSFTAVPLVGYIVPLAYRAGAMVLGVFFTIYAYYLWSDDVALDKARKT